MSQKGTHARQRCDSRLSPAGQPRGMTTIMQPKVIAIAGKHRKGVCSCGLLALLADTRIAMRGWVPVLPVR